MKVQAISTIKSESGHLRTERLIIDIFPAKKPGTTGFWLYSEDYDDWFNTQTYPSEELIKLYVTYLYRRYFGARFDTLLKIIQIVQIQ